METQNPTDMSRRGFARTSFKPGDAVTVIVEPIKGGAPVGRIKSIVLANGRTLVAIGPAPAAPHDTDFREMICSPAEAREYQKFISDVSKPAQ